ncbi:MAG: hypothetical protein KJ755_12615, partial [Alphaproteobacteria bacterium]|nr:hypothetical protein [Alphaproteobacteria bacterium]
MSEIDDDGLGRGAPEEPQADIYDEEGSIRHDFLTMVGAAIADRDVIFLRQNVAKLHESELGHLIEAIQPDQRLAMIRLLGADFDLVRPPIPEFTILGGM